MRTPNFRSRSARAPLAGLAGLVALTGALACGDARIGAPASGPAPVSRAPSAPDSPPAPGVTPTPPASGCADEVNAAIPPRAWRLTADQYRQTVTRLFDGELPPELDALVWPFTGEDNLSGEAFTTLASGPRVVDASFDRSIDAAETVARVLVEAARDDGDHCMSAEPIAQTCLEDFVVDAARALFRRPEVRTDLAPAMASIDAAPPEERAALAEELIFSLFMSPRFLFRLELGTPALTPHELAERISYSLTNAPPDAALRARAEDGTITDPTVIAAQVERLLFGPKGVEKATQFIREYLRYDKLFTVDPRAELRGAPDFRPNELVDDTDALVRHLLETRGRDGFLEALFSTDEVVIQNKTKEYYGDLDDVAGRPQPVRDYVGQRMGLLTQPSWLISFSQGHRNDPIERGRFIREQILCETMPEVAISDVEPLSEDPSVPLATRLRAHTASDDCSGCHRLMDDLGLAFEQYDHFGRFRTEDAGEPVQTAGEIVNGGDANGSFSSTTDFTSRLATSQTVSECFARHAFAFYLGRELTPDEACLARRADGVFREAGQSLPALLAFYFQHSHQR